MAKRIITGLAALSTALVLNGCGATCEDACTNQATVCRDAPAAEGGFGGDQAAADAFATLCTRLCEASLENESTAPCANTQEVVDCSADAADCNAVTACNNLCEAG